MSILKKFKDRVENRRLRDQFARSRGFRDYSAYLKGAPDTDAGVDDRDGYNQWLADYRARASLTNPADTDTLPEQAQGLPGGENAAATGSRLDTLDRGSKSLLTTLDELAAQYAVTPGENLLSRAEAAASALGGPDLTRVPLQEFAKAYVAHDPEVSRDMLIGLAVKHEETCRNTTLTPALHGLDIDL